MVRERDGRGGAESEDERRGERKRKEIDRSIETGNGNEREENRWAGLGWVKLRAAANSELIGID